jgi:hypothetical protein
MSSDPHFLFSVGDANVTLVERDILESDSAWLNDGCIAFFYEHVPIINLPPSASQNASHASIPYEHIAYIVLLLFLESLGI